jgi:uncharacterized protein (DUF433 family)
MTDWRLHLSRDPKVLDGELCAKGTRVPATVVLDSMAEGSSRQEILERYRSLRPEHIDAVVAYAAELAREGSILPLGQV